MSFSTCRSLRWSFSLSNEGSGFRDGPTSMGLRWDIAAFILATGWPVTVKSRVKKISSSFLFVVARMRNCNRSICRTCRNYSHTQSRKAFGGSRQFLLLAFCRRVVPVVAALDNVAYELRKEISAARHERVHSHGAACRYQLWVEKRELFFFCNNFVKKKLFCRTWLLPRKTA